MERECDQLGILETGDVSSSSDESDDLPRPMHRRIPSPKQRTFPIVRKRKSWDVYDAPSRPSATTKKRTTHPPRVTQSTLSFPTARNDEGTRMQSRLLNKGFRILPDAIWDWKQLAIQDKKERTTRQTTITKINHHQKVMRASSQQRLEPPRQGQRKRAVSPRHAEMERGTSQRQYSRKEFRSAAPPIVSSRTGRESMWTSQSTEAEMNIITPKPSPVDTTLDMLMSYFPKHNDEIQYALNLDGLLPLGISIHTSSENGSTCEEQCRNIMNNNTKIHPEFLFPKLSVVKDQFYELTYYLDQLKMHEASPERAAGYEAKCHAMLITLTYMAIMALQKEDSVAHHLEYQIFFYSEMEVISRQLPTVSELLASQSHYYNVGVGCDLESAPYLRTILRISWYWLQIIVLFHSNVEWMTPVQTSSLGTRIEGYKNASTEQRTILKRWLPVHSCSRMMLFLFDLLLYIPASHGTNSPTISLWKEIINVLHTIAPRLNLHLNGTQAKPNHDVWQMMSIMVR